MGAFPEDYEIRAFTLIKLCAAEGFIKPIESKSPDDVAMDYLQDLIDRNLILVRQQGSNGRTKSCSIHDLLLDLCVREGHKEKFLCVLKRTGNASPNDTDGHRHLIIHGNPSPGFCSAVNDSLRSDSVARSLQCTSSSNFLSTPHFGIRLLRVLDLAEIIFDNFPEEVLGLYNLRYLAFTSEGKLPSSISVLKNLQTLIIHQRFSQYVLQLPPEIWEMPKLRHILFRRCVLPDPPCARTNGALPLFPENLVTISVVRDFKCTEENIKRLQNLKKLGLNYEYITSSEQWSCYDLHNLDQLHNLENLKCLFGIFNFSYSAPRPFPPKLSFPPKLKKLTLYGCRLPWKDMTLIGSLPNLEVLKLCNAFEGAVWEPVEGEFQRLKYLKLEMMDLVHWVVDDTHFPSLQNLILKSCFQLTEIPSAIGDIPTLQSVHLVDCSHGAITSANTLIEEQRDLGNDDLEVHISSTEEVKLRRKGAPSRKRKPSLFGWVTRQLMQERRR